MQKITFNEALKLFLYVDDGIYSQGLFPGGRFGLQVNPIVEGEEGLLVGPGTSVTPLLGRA